MITLTYGSTTPNTTSDASSHSHKDQQSLYDPHMMKIWDVERCGATKRPMPPLQGLGTHLVILSQESYQSTYANHTCKSCNGQSFSCRSGIETSMLPHNDKWWSPLLSEETDPRDMKWISGCYMTPSDTPGFLPHLSKMAFARVISSDVFLPQLNMMHIPITLHTMQKKADHLTFLDCGATECFISQQFINQHKLGVQLLETP